MPVIDSQLHLELIHIQDYYNIVLSLLTITTPFALLPSHSKPFELIHLLKLSKITWLFVQPEFLTTALAAAKEVGLSKDRILLLEGHVKGKRCFDDLVRDVQERKLPQVSVRPAKQNTLAYLVFSSGTTGLPKGP
jgi:long-subunit acyl-CoA synthetase (AMP-forming)